MQKTFILPDGTTARFSSQKLKRALAYKRPTLRQSDAASLTTFLDDLAESIGISVSSIKHWSAGHNGPSDLDKVRDLARALDVDMMDLLEIKTEEQTTMNMEDIKLPENKKYTSAADAVQNFYSTTSYYIECSRTAYSADNLENLRKLFRLMYMQLRSSRLELPKDIFDRLLSFYENYLQQMGCFLRYEYFAVEIPELEGTLEEYLNIYDCPPCAPWCDFLYVSLNPESEDSKLFEQSLAAQYKFNDDIISDFGCEILIQGAYTRLDDIFQDYMI